MVKTIISLNTGSVDGGTGWHLVVLSQNRVVLVTSVICFQKIYGLHGDNHQFIQHLEKEKVMMDRQMDKRTDLTPSVEGVE